MRYALALPALVALTLVLPLSAQGTASAPISATRLRAAIHGPDLVFTWESAANPEGGWALYRSASAFSEATFPSAERVATIPPAQRSTTVTARDRKAWYYALLSLSSSGSPVKSFQPGSTVTAAALTAETVGETPPADGLAGFTATAGISSIVLAINIPSGNGNMIVYRAVAPFRDATSLLSASLLATIPESTKSFVDYPLPGTSYWYALVRESDIKAGTVTFTSSGSPSLGPVAISAPALTGIPFPATGDLSRYSPLPSWVFAKPGDPGIGQFTLPLSQQTEKSIALILAPYPKSEPGAPAVSVLQVDRDQPRGGEDYALSLIVQGSFKSSDWKTSIDQIQRYLSLNRSPLVAARAHFYLGESFAMTAQYRDAFFEFLKAREFYQPESRPWILWLVAMLRSS